MPTDTYKKIQPVQMKEPLPDRVYNVLKESILTGNFLPGEALPEDLLTEATGASRTPVRAALLRLQADGLVQIEPRKCARVVALTRDEMLSLCEARVVFETAFFDKAVKNIARNVFKSYLKKLERAASQIQAAEDNKEILLTQITRYRELDFGLHTELVAATENPFWLDFYRSIIDRIKIYSLLVQNRFPSFYHDSHEEHIAFLTTILKDDMSEAKWLLREHLQHFIDRSMQLYSEQNADKALTL